MKWSVEGAGEPLLLVRPLGGSMALWGRFRDRLAERLRVISFDARESPPRVSTRAMAEDALAVLDEAGIPEAHVFGESLGGMVATWLAIDAPARVNRLVLASTLPRGTMTGVVSSVRGAKRGLALARCFTGDRHAAARCVVRRLLSEEFRLAHPDEATRIEDAFAREGLSRKVSFAHLLAAGRHDAAAELHAIAAPTLVLCGGHDPLITIASQRTMLGAIPDASFEVIAHAGHAVTLEQPDAAAERVAAHLLG